MIPARNEENNIGKTIVELRSLLQKEQIEHEIIVVDDGSTDNTPKIVESLTTDDPNVRLIRNVSNLHGYGRAVRLGLEYFTGEAVVVFMADRSDNPSDVIKYYHILKDEAECAFGSRWMRGGKVVDYPKIKLILNRLANLFIRLIFGIRYNDVTNAFKGYRATVIEGCKPFLSPHFNLTVEIPLKAIVRGYTYSVTPIGWRNRDYGQSNLKIDEMGSRYLYIVLNVWLEWLLTKGD